MYVHVNYDCIYVFYLQSLCECLNENCSESLQLGIVMILATLSQTVAVSRLNADSGLTVSLHLFVVVFYAEYFFIKLQNYRGRK